MDEQLTKSITDLIDETLVELEELRKSRFEAAEIHLAGPADTEIGGQGPNGKLKDHEMDKDEDDKDKDEDKDDKDMDKGEDKDDKDKDEDKDDKDMDKGEWRARHAAGSEGGENRQADPNGGAHVPPNGEGMRNGQGPSHSPKGASAKSGGENRQSDPNGGDHKPAYEGARKSIEESETLMKSYVEERVRPLEDKLTTILELVNKIAEQPIAPKGMTARGTPLFKSNETFEHLTKADIGSKLFELKKSGSKVDTLDIIKVDMGQDLAQIAQKYQLS